MSAICKGKCWITKTSSYMCDPCLTQEMALLISKWEEEK